MYIRDINPHIRFAADMRYEIRYNHRTVKVIDCRIFYVTAGSAQVQIDSKTYILLPGCLFYCSAGSRYTIHAQAGFSILCFNFDLSLQNYTSVVPIPPISDPAQIQTMVIYWEQIQDSPFLNSHLFVQKATHLHDSLEQILDTFLSIDPLHCELASTQLKFLLLKLHKSFSENIPPKITLVKNYIQQNYRKNISNKDLSALVGYHDYHLNRIFKQHTRLNLHEYLLKVRLNRANSLILNTDLPLKEIAENTGFSSYAHFSTAYKKEYSLSPLQYRKQIKQHI